MGIILTLDDLKGDLPIRPGNTDFDADLDKIIDTVDLQFEHFCRRKFSVDTYSEIFHVQAGAQRHYDFLSDTNTYGVYLKPDGAPYMLANTPLISAATVEVYYDTEHRFTADKLLSADDYVVLAEKSCIYINKALRQSRDSIKIVYEAGFADIPADLHQAGLMQAMHLFNRSRPENVSTSTDKDDKNTPYSVKAGLLPEVAMMIAPYRRLLRGRG